jgi:hypothetical protein
VLGHNYPQSSSWYKQAYELLQKQGLSPQINAEQPARQAQARADRAQDFVSCLFLLSG